MRERLRLAGELAEATAEWERKAASTSAWNARACAAAGQRALRLAALDAPPATVIVTRRNFLGVVVPKSAETPDASCGKERDRPPLAEAHAEALTAALELAVLRAPHEEVEEELRKTVRRLRAIERRWIPEHEAALRKLELMLKEVDLADIARARWAALRPR